MHNNVIKCPHCGKNIEITEVLTHSIREAMKMELEGELAKKEAEFGRQQTALQQKEKELARQKEAIEEQVAEKVKAERKAIAETERQKILAEQAEQQKALRVELVEKDHKIKEFQQQELELRRQQRKLQEEREAFELEAARKMDEERKKIAEEAGKRAVEEQMLKLKEKDQLIESLRKQAQDWQRRAEVGSQEAQGEALEGQLQGVLQQTFPYDQFDEVKKGARGGDIVQTVRNAGGTECGKILWESKNTKEFQKGWVEKLKKDQQECGAVAAVIMSMVLPKEIERFGLYEEVWLTDYKSAVGLAGALRQGLIRTQRERMVTAGRESVKDVVYNYVTSHEFAMRVRAMVDSYAGMKAELEGEKRAMLRIWSRREKQIGTVLENVTAMYGAIEGLVGRKALPAMEPLSLEGIGEEEGKEGREE